MKIVELGTAFIEIPFAEDVVVTVDVLFCTARLDIALDSFSRLDVI
jgi:hypothetical protein